MKDLSQKFLRRRVSWNSAHQGQWFAAILTPKAAFIWLWVFRAFGGCLGEIPQSQVFKNWTGNWFGSGKNRSSFLFSFGNTKSGSRFQTRSVFETLNQDSVRFSKPRSVFRLVFETPHRGYVWFLKSWSVLFMVFETPNQGSVPFLKPWSGSRLVFETSNREYFPDAIP